MVQRAVDKLDLSVDKTIAFTVALGFYLKEFYILPSGSLQIGDIILIIAFAMCLFSRRIHLIRLDMPLFAFSAFSIIVNLVYFLYYYYEKSFLIFSSYIIFSLIIVLLERSILNNRAALNFSLFALKSALITQVIVSILGKGRYLFGRYIGTFNDPNQFAYYVFMCILLIYVIHFLCRKKMHLVWLFIAGYLILLSQSSGILLGFSIFIALYLWRITGTSSKYIKVFSRIGAVFILLLSIVLLFTIGDFIQSGILNNMNISGLQRLINRMSTGNSVMDFLNLYIKDRSMTRILINPWGLLFGTGEGLWSRYVENNEIHATMISLCFYYGLIPFLCWLLWIRNNLQNLNAALTCAYVAHIAEAFTLANHRQPFFWIMFVLASSQFAKVKNEDDNG